MDKIIYISGKITNNDNAFKDFEQAEMQIRMQGDKAINVMKLNSVIPFFSYNQYMQLDFRLIELSDEVYVIGDWKTSKGVKAEIAYAKAIGKPVKFESKQWRYRE